MSIKQNLRELFDSHHARYNMFLLSEASGVRRDFALKYLCDKISDHDAGSDFAKSLGKYSGYVNQENPNRLRNADVMLSLADWFLGYDAIMLEDASRSTNKGGPIIGYTAFQVHGFRPFVRRSLHIFSIELHEDYFGEKIGAYMCYGAMEVAIERDIKKLRIGKGVNEHAERTINTLVAGQTSLGLDIQKKGAGWIDLKLASNS